MPSPFLPHLMASIANYNVVVLQHPFHLPWFGCHSACNSDPRAGGSASKIDPLNVGLLRCSL